MHFRVNYEHFACKLGEYGSIVNIQPFRVEIKGINGPGLPVNHRKVGAPKPTQRYTVENLGSIDVSPGSFFVEHLPPRANTVWSWGAIAARINNKSKAYFLRPGKSRPDSKTGDEGVFFKNQGRRRLSQEQQTFFFGVIDPIFVLFGPHN